jgi:hypothetical protein
MKVKPRIVGISATGSKIDIQVEADGVLLPVQRVHVADIMEGGENADNAFLLARYEIRKKIKEKGRSKSAIEEIRDLFEQLNVEVDL